MNNRREFLKTGGVVCVAACGMGTLVALLQSCKPSQILHVSVSNNQINVPLTSFADKKVVIVSNMNLDDNIAVIKKSDTEYTAILMQCTHRENPVDFTGNGFYCPSHGSKFDMDGNVTKEPATQPLKKYATSVANGQVVIKLA